MIYFTNLFQFILGLGNAKNDKYLMFLYIIMGKKTTKKHGYTCIREFSCKIRMKKLQQYLNISIETDLELKKCNTTQLHKIVNVFFLLLKKGKAKINQKF